MFHPSPGKTTACGADTPGPSQVNKMVVGSELEAPIQRIFYLRHEGRQRDHEVFPDPNPALLADLEACDAVLYGMGSLYTSICPSLILQVRSVQSQVRLQRQMFGCNRMDLLGTVLGIQSSVAPGACITFAELLPCMHESCKVCPFGACFSNLYCILHAITPSLKYNPFTAAASYIGKVSFVGGWRAHRSQGCTKDCHSERQSRQGDISMHGRPRPNGGCRRGAGPPGLPEQAIH